MINYIRHLATLLIVFTLSFNAVSAQISPQQIEQFKSLPKSQQQALAKSMGVDLNAVMGQISGSSQASELSSPRQLHRDTNSDR